MLEVTVEDFARLFGTTVDDIPEDCQELITKTDSRYTKLSGDERDKVAFPNVLPKKLGDRLSGVVAHLPVHVEIVVEDHERAGFGPCSDHGCRSSCRVDELQVLRGAHPSPGQKGPSRHKLSQTALRVEHLS